MYALAFSPPCHFTLECQGPFTALTTSGLVFRSLTNWFSLSTLSSLRTFSLSCPCIIFLPRRNLQRCSSEPLSCLTDRLEFCKGGLRIVHRAFRECSESTVRIQIDARWIKELCRFTNSADH